MFKDNPIKFVLGILLLAIVYIITGLLGLTLAVPPGYATVFWPPSGLALAAVYLFGSPICLGVFLGSFTVNVLNSYDLIAAGQGSVLWINALFIALGSTAQACLGARLVKYAIGEKAKLETFREIFKFSFLTGPISCLIAASVGASTLISTGSIPLSNVPFTWGSWYVGDMLGVLVLAPALILFFAGKAVSSKRKIYTIIPLVFIFVIVIAGFFYIKNKETDIQLAEFLADTEFIEQEIETKIQDYFQESHAILSLYKSSERVNEQEFQVFTDHIITRDMPSGGIGYAYVLRPNTESDLNIILEEEGIGDFRLKSMNGDHSQICDPYCVPLLFLHPPNLQDKVRGLDLMTEQNRANVLRQAVENKELKISRPIILSQSKKKGFFSALPIVMDNDNESKVWGVIINAGSFELLFDPVMEKWSAKGVHMTVRDVEEDEIVYFDMHGKNMNENFQTSYTQELAGRLWEYTFYMNNDYIYSNVNWNIWFALALSLLFSFLMSVFLLVITGQTAAIEIIVEDKTKQLSDNNRFMKVIMDSVPDLIFVKDRFSNIVQANKAFLKQYSSDKRDDLVGTTTFEHYPDHEAEVFFEQDKKAFRLGYSETDQKNTDYKGITRDFFTRKIKFETKDGTPYLLAVARDVTEEKQTLEKLQKSEARFRASLEHAPIGLSLVGMNQHWIVYNKALAEMMGYNEEEFGNTYLPNLTYPEDLTKDKEQIIDLLNNEIQSYSVEKRYIKKDGSLVWVLLTLALVRDDDNKPLYYVAHALDITDRKKAEETQLQLRKIVDSSLAEFFIYDSESLKFLNANRGALKNLGYSRKNILGKAITDIMPDFDNKSFKNKLAPLLNGEVPNLELDTYFERKDGSFYDVLINIQLIDYQERKACMAIVLDITTRKQMENDILRSNEELQQFAYVASHDLKAPLRHISLSAGFLSEQYKDSLDEKASDLLKIMVKGTERMQNMIDSLLAYSQVGQKSSDDLEDVNLNDLIEEAEEMLTSPIQSNEAKIITKNTDINFKGNKFLLIQLLQNLIQNAIKYRKDDIKPKITIEAEKNKGFVTVSVTDNGIGINAEYAEKIFDVFQRLHGEGRYEGTGIGLAICRRILDAHHGEIWLDEKYKKGSKFVFKLPVV